MTTLTAQEIAEVATTVTGFAWETYSGHAWHFHAYGRDIWCPLFDKGDYKNRSQALAVVEWLADKIEELHAHGKISQMKMYELFSDVMLAVKADDIQSLIGMVLELKRGR